MPRLLSQAVEEYLAARYANQGQEEQIGKLTGPLLILGRFAAQTVPDDPEHDAVEPEALSAVGDRRTPARQPVPFAGDRATGREGRVMWRRLGPEAHPTRFTGVNQA